MSHVLSGSEHFSEQESNFMKEAFNEARLALRRAEVPVGCVLVDTRTQRIISRGSNDTSRTCDATRHAEFVALENLESPFPERIDVYVTLEPCIMCAAALSMHGRIANIVFGAKNEKFGGCGGVLQVAGMFSTLPPVETLRGGLGSVEAIDLLQQFYLRSNEKTDKPRENNMQMRLAKKLHREGGEHAANCGTGLG